MTGGYFAFVHEKGLTAPSNFRALAESDLKILIQDPRSSTPGLGLLLWVKAAYGDEAPAIWAGLADNIVTVTKGWSEAYGLFLEGEADMVLSYTTSPAYHLIAEEDASKRAAIFDEGHLPADRGRGEAGGERSAGAGGGVPRLHGLGRGAGAASRPPTGCIRRSIRRAVCPRGSDLPVSPEKVLLVPAGEVAGLRDEALAEWLDALSR